jgi:hypothetical protein
VIGADADLDRLAEDLRVDGVVVDRVMGSGEAQEANDRIAALIRDVPFKVYVALIDAPAGGPEDPEALAGLLSRRLGDGFYVIQTSDSPQTVLSFGLDSDPSLLSLSAYANEDVLDEAASSLAGDYVVIPAAVEAEAQVLTAEALVDLGRRPAPSDSDYPPALTDADADRLAERALELQAAADWRPAVDEFVEVRTASGGLSALVGSLAALVIALLLGQSLRGWPRFRRVLPAEAVAKQVAAAPPPDLEAERARARDLADALTTALAGTDWEQVADRDVAGRALTARDAVEPLLASDDVADVVGAQVVARAGERDLARGARGTGGPLVTCFFDPRHPAGKKTASWRLGDGEVDVPCCAACAARVAKGQSPDHLRLRARRGTTPYWDRDDVWARTGFGATTDFLARDVLADRAGDR